MNTYFQLHHDNPTDVLINKSIWFSGTHSYCIYSIPSILMTVFVHKLTKNHYIVQLQVLSLVLGYFSIRNHILCHASNRGYKLDF